MVKLAEKTKMSYRLNPLDTNVKFDAYVPTGGPFGPPWYSVIMPMLGLKTKPRMCKKCRVSHKDPPFLLQFSQSP